MRYIARSARIGSGCRLGHFAVIHDDVELGRDCAVGDGAVLHPGTIVGDGVRIDDGASVGKRPLRARNSAVTRAAELPPARIGDECMVGTGAVIYAGAEIGRAVLIADLATVRERVSIGDFTIVGRGVAIENDCRIGRWCKLETNVYVTAYSLLEDRVFLAPGVVTSNDNFVGRTQQRFEHFKGVTIRRGGRVGINCTILPGVTIGADALIAAGSVVTADAPPRTILLGAPARPLRPVPEEQLLDNQGWES